MWGGLAFEPGGGKGKTNKKYLNLVCSGQLLCKMAADSRTPGDRGVTTKLAEQAQA